jgi:hypothetical protein
MSMASPFRALFLSPPLSIHPGPLPNLPPPRARAITAGNAPPSPLGPLRPPPTCSSVIPLAPHPANSLPSPSLNRLILCVFLAVAVPPLLRHLRLGIYGVISLSEGHLRRSSSSPPFVLPSLSTSSEVSSLMDDSRPLRKLPSTLFALSNRGSECSSDVMWLWGGCAWPCLWSGEGFRRGGIRRKSRELVGELGPCCLKVSLALFREKNSTTWARGEELC